MRGTGLGPAIVIFVGLATFASAIVAFREPRVLPGRDMDAVGNF